ncbi:polysaccharide biosynthesis/export family protein [Planctomycetota bacterium]
MKRYRSGIIGKLQSSILSVFLGSMLLFGCQLNSIERSYPRPSEIEMKESILQRVALAPGDVVEVKFFYTPELDEIQTVRSDGQIMLQLVGEVEVEGRTPAELREELLGLYASYLKAPEITVVVESFQNHRVFVGGQVITPGIIEMPGKMNVLEAIMQTGGFDLREAEIQNVVIIRHRNGKRYGYSINLEPALVGGETKPFYLEPKDIVYVPRTKIAKLNQWVDQHINSIIPDTGLIFRKTYGNTMIGVGSSR